MSRWCKFDGDKPCKWLKRTTLGGVHHYDCTHSPHEGGAWANHLDACPKKRRKEKESDGRAEKSE